MASKSHTTARFVTYFARIDYNFLRQFLIYDRDCASVVDLEFKAPDYRKLNA